MRVSILLLLAGCLAVGASATAQERTPPAAQKEPEKEKKDEKKDDKKEIRNEDGLRDPYVEMAKRAEKDLAEKNYQQMKDAAEELATLSRKMSDEISQGGKDVMSATVYNSLDKIERLAKQIRDKANAR